MPRALALLAPALALGLVACAAATPAGTASGTGGTVAVVASTNVYGDIARAVGGDAVTVTSIIDDPSKDPHDYTADARTLLALSKAQVVIENGAGYDDFVATMLGSLTHARPTVVDVADVSGYDQHPADGEFDEHLWYDVPTVVAVVGRLRDELSVAAPAHAATFGANAAAYTGRLRDLERTEADVEAHHAGAGVAITEPVPDYLLRACGLVNLTPEAFSEAIEEDTDVAPAVLRATLDLFASRRVALLVYNQQTTGPQTQAVLTAAQQHGVAVVGVTEILPAGQTYLSWMTANLAAVSAGLGA